MNGILLDTNALLWVLAGDEDLGDDAQTQLAATGPVHFSAVSVLEITIEEILGRLEVPGEVPDAAKQAGMVELPFRSAHASGLKEFPALARHDPFDRMLLSQAHSDGLLLCTSDRHLLALGFEWVIDARR